MSNNKIEVNFNSRLSFGLLTYLGGAFFVGNQPGMGFWDGLIWMWYVGRFIAAHFALLHY
jgi:hypothetical protein